MRQLLMGEIVGQVERRENGRSTACLLALLGPALLFLGVIRDGWLLITAALYVTGYLSTPSPRVLDVKLAESLSFDALLAQFNKVVAAARPQLQRPMLARLDSIRHSIEEVLPRLMANHGFDDNLFTVRETIGRYLPETLASYVALPPMFRLTRVLKDGKTARDLLMDQLAVLDDQLKQVVVNVARGDADALLANGQFLEAKFRDRDFLSTPSENKSAA